MSYCVHCGVELEPSLKKCPLCNTPVLDPNNIPCFETSSPYPDRRGKVEPARRKDAAIFVSVLLITISITCGLFQKPLVPSGDRLLPDYLGDLHSFYLLQKTIPLPRRPVGRNGSLFLPVPDLPPDRLRRLALLFRASDHCHVYLVI